jgi:hypothetical protein
MQKWQCWWQQHQTKLLAMVVGYVAVLVLHALVNLTVPSGKAVLGKVAPAELSTLDADIEMLNQAASMLHERKVSADAAAAQGLVLEQPTTSSETAIKPSST